MKGDHAVLDPETIAAHQIGQHDVGGQPVSNNGNLAGTGDARFRVVPEILHDLGTTARLFGLVRQHRHTGGPLQFCGQLPFRVTAKSTGSVGNYEKSAAWICSSEGIEAFLTQVISSKNPRVSREAAR